MLSRLESEGHATVCTDMEPPDFAGLSEEADFTQTFHSIDWSVGDEHDTDSELIQDSIEDEHELLGKVDSYIDHILVATESPHRPEPPRRTSMQEMLEEQLPDEFCKNIRDAINTEAPSGFFEDGRTGVLESIAELHETLILVKSCIFGEDEN